MSFEVYDLDFGAALRDNNFTRVGPRIAALGLRGVPMLTTANIAKLRELWQSPAALADAATAAVVAGGFSGLNVDFEPENGDPPTAADARSFAAFVDMLAKRLHAADPRLELTVDIASWSAFWDFGLLAETAVDRLLTMDTYCGNTTLFEQRLVKAVSAIGIAKLGIGLETVNPNTGKPFTLDEMQARFALIRKFGIQEIDVRAFPFFSFPSFSSSCDIPKLTLCTQIWEAPIPELWVPLIQDWVNSK